MINTDLTVFTCKDSNSHLHTSVHCNIDNVVIDFVHITGLWCGFHVSKSIACSINIVLTVIIHQSSHLCWFLLYLLKFLITAYSKKKCLSILKQEPYMEGVNPFIKNNKHRMIMFLDELGVS